MAGKKPLPIFSRRLREARTAYGISQRELGIRAGIDPGAASPRVNRYETGVHQPDLQTLKRMANVLGVPPPFFYAEEDELAKLIAQFGKRALTTPEQD